MVISITMEALAKHDFVPNDPDTELAFRRGDKLRILNYGDNVEWYNAEMDGQVGLVPGNYIQIEQPSWYFGRISRSQAEQLLLGEQREGAFLVRLSESAPTEFSLSVKCSNSVQHFRILKDNDHQYFLWSTRFNNLNELVEHYRKETVSRNSQIFLCDWDNYQFIGRGMYDFGPDHEQPEGEAELYFKKGDLIVVQDTRDDNWWAGRMGLNQGFFPRLYVTPWVLNPNGRT